MYNLLGNNANYSNITGSLWFCSTDEASHFSNDIASSNDFKSFNYRTKLLKTRQQIQVIQFDETQQILYH